MLGTRIATAALAAGLGLISLTSSADACDRMHEFSKRRSAIEANADTADQARDHYLLGVWAKENGLTDAANKQFARTLELAPHHAGAHDALGHVFHDDRWLARDEAMEAKGLVLRDGAWILTEEAALLDLPAKQRALLDEQKAKARKLLDMIGAGGERARKFAKDALGTIDDEALLEPMAFALRHTSEDVRTLAAEELGRLENRRALRPLLHRAIYDPSEAVRHASIDAAKQIGDANLIAPLVRALGSESETTRMNAATAIGRADDVRGVQYLVYRFEAHGGGAPRAFAMFANQLTFIQDFDVEVAATAFIADPIVSTIQEGIVLDVNVVATEIVEHWVEREVIHGALQRLTGADDVPNEKGAWAKWFASHEETLTAAR